MIHPNPNNGSFTITLNYVTTKTTVEICDKNGEKMYQGNITSIEQTLDLELPKGAYSLRVFEDNLPVGIRELIIEK
jgi:hypothetical protein